jgi:hypothetical protein
VSGFTQEGCNNTHIRRPATCVRNSIRPVCGSTRKLYSLALALIHVAICVLSLQKRTHARQRVCSANSQHTRTLDVYFLTKKSDRSHNILSRPLVICIRYHPFTSRPICSLSLSEAAGALFSPIPIFDFRLKMRRVFCLRKV